MPRVGRGPSRRRRLALGLASLVVAGVARAQRPAAPGAPLVARLDSVTDAYARSGDFSGVVLVAERGRVLYERARGFANREWRVPNTADAVFRIGSTTKQFTAALALGLVEEGRLRLDGRITDYLPDYPRAQGARVTVRQLLTHSSGIPDYVSRDSFFVRSAPAPTTPAALIARFATLPLDFAPGTRWAYSNSNYVVLATILERVSRRPYADLLRARIAAPLGLTTLAVDDDAVVPRLASGYFALADRIVREPHVDATSAFGAGALRATARDLLAWDQALYSGRIFRDTATARALVAPRIATGTPLGDYGFGVFVGTQRLGGRDVRVIQHGGTISGFVTGFWRMPGERRTVVVLSNVRGARTTQLAGALADVLYR